MYPIYKYINDEGIEVLIDRIPLRFTGKIIKIESEIKEIVFYLENGLLDREDGPAVENNNGTKLWYLKGVMHRENGPAIEYSNGDREWYLNGKRHRRDGPAVESSNQWFYEGQSIKPLDLFEILTEEEKEKAAWNINEWIQ